jgi:AraC-like DNA-binding protein
MTEIADMVGYGSLSHFSREFKKFYGENPTSIQKKGPKNAE